MGQSQTDSRLVGLIQFTESLLDSVQTYIEKSKKLQTVGKHESEDFLKKFTKTQKGISDLISNIVKDVEELKPAIDAKIAKALEFTSLMEKEDVSPKVPSFNFNPKPASTLQNLFNLKKTLNSPRDVSGRDRSRGEETTRSGKSREPVEKTVPVEHLLAMEHLRNQVAVLQSELERKEGRSK